MMGMDPPSAATPLVLFLPSSDGGGNRAVAALAEATAEDEEDAAAAGDSMSAILTECVELDARPWLEGRAPAVPAAEAASKLPLSSSGDR